MKIAANENGIQLVKLCKRGNTKAQFQVYKLYSKAMFNVAVRMTSNSQLAEDVLQDAFIKAFTDINRLNDEKAFGGWLKRIVINRCIDVMRKEHHFLKILYSCNMRAGDFGGSFTIEAKYSKVFLDEIRQDADINFYDSDLEFTSCGDAKITSKYSKLEGEKTGKLVIESYDDKFFIEEANSLKLIAKYSDFVSEANVTNISLELYDCNVKVKSSERATFNGKYSDVTLGDLIELKINDSYDNNIHLGNSKNIQIGKSKYTQFEIEAITNFSIDDLYDDNIKIEKLNPDFSKLSINGKYGKLDVEAGSVPFKVAFKIKYPKVNLPESLKIIKQIKNNSDLELVAGNIGGKITVEGYDMKVAIVD